jgi:hypothetical protein
MRLPHSRWKVGAGCAVFVGVAGKQHQVNLFINGCIDDGIERLQKIEHAHGQSRTGSCRPWAAMSM